MRYLVLCLFLILILAGCGGSPGGSPGSDTGSSGLFITSYGTLETPSVDSFRDVCSGGEWEEFTTHMVTFNVTVTDLYNQYANLPQGVTFQRYTITYLSSVVGAPPLQSKTVYQGINVPLGGSQSASVSQDVELFGLETKDEFATYINNGTYNPVQWPVSYTVTLVFSGNDWITNESVSTQFSVNVEVGNFDNC